MQPWKPWVRVGAIDCANANNTDTCASHNITGFPTLKIFRAGATSGEPDPPDHKGGRTLQALRQAVATRIAAAEPNDGLLRLIPVETAVQELETISSTDEIWVLCNVSNGANLTVPWGRELALDLAATRANAEVQVKMIAGDGVPSAPFSALAGHVDVRKPLALVHLTSSKGGKVTFSLLHDDEPKRLGLKEKGYHDFRAPFLSAAKLAGLTTDVGSHSPISDHVPDSTPPRDTSIPANEVAASKAESDSSILRDAIAAALHALWQEVPLHGSLSGNKLGTLQKFCWTITSALPLPPAGQFKGGGQADLLTVFTLLSQRLAVAVSVRKEVSSTEYRAMLSEALREGRADHLNVAQIGNTWHHCQGSQAHLRGYPCGLWTLFHTLTAVATISGDDAAAVFDAIIGYVTIFFGCRECSDNFAREIEIWAADGVPRATYGSVTLFLWTVHNRANLRLGAHANATNNDPNHPKLEYPSQESCPTCRRDPDFETGIAGDTEWNESAVLEHLLFRYGVLTRQQSGRGVFAPRSLRQMSAGLVALDGTRLYTDQKSGQIMREEGRRVVTKFGGTSDVEHHGAAGGVPNQQILITPRDTVGESWLWRVWVVVFLIALVTTVYLKINPMAVAYHRMGGKRSPLLPTSILRKNID